MAKTALHNNLNKEHNGLRAGDRNPVLRLRQGYGACTLLWVGLFVCCMFYARPK
jgi:hypothetical protein